MIPVRRLATACAAFAILLAASLAPAARETLPGPVPVEVVEVIDGDTLRVRARIWLGQAVETAVRLAGIDAPELDSDCARERRLAVAARDYVVRLLAGGGVSLHDIRQDKYGGRVLARVDSSGRDLAVALVGAGLAQIYDGGKRRSWC